MKSQTPALKSNLRLTLSMLLCALFAIAGSGCNEMYYGGRGIIQGRLTLSDGVTPLANASVQLLAPSDLELHDSQPFFTDYDGNYVTNVYVGEWEGAPQSTAQLTVQGTLGVLVESQIIQYRADLQPALRQIATNGCLFTFTSRVYLVEVTEAKDTGVTTGTLNASVNVTPAEIEQVRQCQLKALQDATNSL